MPGTDAGRRARVEPLNYEDDVHHRVNPLLPIPRGYGVNLLDPETGRPVYFDDCFRYAGDLVDGNMQAGDLVEAKGKIRFLLAGQVDSDYVETFVAQEEKELRTADARGVGLKYYFAEESAAERAREIFEEEKLDRIVVSHMPPRGRK